MRSIIRLLLLASAVWLACPSQAQTVISNLTYTFQDFTTAPQAVKRITLTPLQPFADYPGVILSAQPITRLTDTNGTYVFTNVISGYSYRVQLDTPYNSVIRTNGFPTGLTGNVNGRDYLGVYAGQSFAWFYQTNTVGSNFVNQVGQNVTNYADTKIPISTNLVPAGAQFTDKGDYGGYNVTVVVGQLYFYYDTNLADGFLLVGTSIASSMSVSPNTLFTATNTTAQLGNLSFTSGTVSGQLYAVTNNFYGKFIGDGSALTNVSAQTNFLVNNKPIIATADSTSEHIFKRNGHAGTGGVAIFRNLDTQGYNAFAFHDYQDNETGAMGSSNPNVPFATTNNYIEAYLGQKPWVVCGTGIYGWLNEASTGDLVWFSTTAMNDATAIPANEVFRVHRANGGVLIKGSLTNSALTASTTIVTDANKALASSSTTAAELAFVHNVTSAIQTQLNGKAASSHTHAESDVVNLASDLAAKAALTAAQTFTASNTFTGGLSVTTQTLNTNNATGNYITETNGSIIISNAATGASISLTNNAVTSQHFGGIKVSSGPTVVVAAGAGTGATADFTTDSNPNDSAMRVHLVTGSSATANSILATVTFSKAWATKPKVVMKCTTKNSGIGASMVTSDATTVSTTSFDIVGGSSAIISSTAYDIDIICLQ